MQKYIRCHIVEAEPMTRGDYNKFRGWEIPANENPADEGYKVVYPDGYVSWCPKAQFEAAGHLVETPIDRMIFEQDELQDRLSKLCAFMETEKFLSLTPANRILLERQKAAMIEYRDVLDVRIEHMDFQKAATAGCQA